MSQQRPFQTKEMADLFAGSVSQTDEEKYSCNHGTWISLHCSTCFVGRGASARTLEANIRIYNASRGGPVFKLKPGQHRSHPWDLADVTACMKMLIKMRRMNLIHPSWSMITDMNYSKTWVTLAQHWSRMEQLYNDGMLQSLEKVVRSIVIGSSSSK